MLAFLTLAALAAPARRAPDPDPPVLQVEEPVALPAGCARVVTPVTQPGVPVRRPDDLPALVPGVWLGQSQGVGAARDRAWRGFGASRGADVEVTVDDVPVNLVGHAGGSGWADVGWLPRLLVHAIDACPGVTDGAVGPGATAGSWAFSTGVPQEGWFLGLGAGTDSSGQLTVAFRPKGWSRRTYVAVEAEEGTGVGIDRGWRDLRLAAGVEADVRELRLSAHAALHDSGWDVPPRVREPDVTAGDVGFRESYRLWAGEGRSQRAQLTLGVTRPWTWGGVAVKGWFAATGVSLADNLTGFAVDPVLGDGRVREGATYDTGLRARVQRVWPLWGDDARFEAGLEVRGTQASTSRAPVDLERTPTAAPETAVRGWLDVAPWVQGRLGFRRVLDVEAGLRVDRQELSFATPADDAPVIGGATTWSAHVALRARPSPVAGLWLAWSRGTRPARADDLVLDRAVPPTADTVTFGLALDAGDRFQATVDAWAVFGRDELVIDPLTDQLVGRVEAARRLGGTLTLLGRPYPGLRVTADAAVVDARDSTTGALLPWVAPVRFGLGAWADDRPLGPVTLTAGLRLQWASPRPLPDDGLTTAVTTLDLRGRIGWKKWRFDVAIDNLAPWDWPDHEAIYASRWDRTAEEETVARHLVPGRPFAVLIGFGRWL